MYVSMEVERGCSMLRRRIRSISAIRRLREAREHRVGLLAGQVFDVGVVDLHHRRGAAGGEALDLGEGEAAIGRRLADADAELVLEVRDDLLGAEQRAREVRAHLEVAAPDR